MTKKKRVGLGLTATLTPARSWNIEHTGLYHHPIFQTPFPSSQYHPHLQIHLKLRFSPIFKAWNRHFEALRQLPLSFPIQHQRTLQYVRPSAQLYHFEIPSTASNPNSSLSSSPRRMVGKMTNMTQAELGQEALKVGDTVLGGMAYDAACREE